jgi:HK97 family phage portal protein
LRIFGLEISRPQKATPAAAHEAPSDATKSADSLTYAPDYQGGWTGGGAWSWPAIRESFTGAWQRGIIARPEMVANYHAVYASVTLIASDIGKLRIKLVEQDRNGIWSEVQSPSFSPVLTRPNRYQNRIKFLEQWVTSKLLHGNAYILKERDARGVVTDLYVLNPSRVKPLVAPDGSIYYQLSADWLSGVPEAQDPVPASEIIHDTMNALFHPLSGTSPIYACGLAAGHGLSIQRNSANFFANGARPGGILTAPGKINEDQAKRLKARWQEHYSGENTGTVAIMGDGLAYQPMVMSAVDAQLIDQLKMTAEMICSVFHVPPYMLGLAEMPAQIAVEALNQQYYTQCLQILIESIELCLDEGLGLVNVAGHAYGSELDLDGLLRMDAAAQYKTYGDGILAGLLKPDEGRAKLDLPPVPGGNAVYLQQQNYSLEALSKRDAKADPFATDKPAPAGQSDSGPSATANDNQAQAAAVKRSWGRLNRGS